MKKTHLYFIAPLSYANDSLIGIQIASSAKIEKWNIDKTVDIISQCGVFDCNAVHTILRELYCLDQDEEHAYVIVGSAEDIERAENAIKIMRLFKEGTIDIAHIYSYEKIKGSIEPVYSRESSLISPQIQYFLTSKEKRELTTFMKHYTVPFLLPYVQLAFDNFDQSYSSHNMNMAFLSLMIAVEVLFNDGEHELKYRITRGMAVLLGNNQLDSRQIFSHMKKLYDKRSRLVHTGKASITLEDLIALRQYLRFAITKLLYLGLNKTELSVSLSENGFGQKIKQGKVSKQSI